MYRHFTDRCGAFEIPDKKMARDKITEHLIKVVAKNIEHNLDIEITTSQ